MKKLIILVILVCLVQIVDAQTRVPSMHISMGETPGINLSNSELNGPIKEITELTYYSKIDETDVDTSKANIKTIMKFDKEGNETEELKYSRNGKLLSKCSYDYSNPKVIVVRKFIQDTTLLGKYIFTYDENKKIVRLDIFLGKINIAAFKTIYKYNNKGYKEAAVDSAGNVILSRSNFQYNNENKIINSSRHDFRGNLIDKIDFKYDDLGNITENISINIIGLMKTLTKRTKMDKYGNWQLTTTDENPHSGFGDASQETIIKRIILYY